MKNNVVIATHHKTGTVWMATVFKAIAEDLGATYVDYWAERDNLAEALKPPFVLFNYDSDFRGHADLLDRDDVRILHLIRDPRDVLISAMHYHCKAGETWLHEPVPGYDNITYQRRLNAFATRHEQYVFEMENSTFSTLRDMQKWRYGRPNCFEARYEKLRQDTEMSYWSGAMSFPGLRCGRAEGLPPALLAVQPVRQPRSRPQACPLGRRRPVEARVHAAAGRRLPLEVPPPAAVARLRARRPLGRSRPGPAAEPKPGPGRPGVTAQADRRPAVGALQALERDKRQPLTGLSRPAALSRRCSHRPNRYPWRPCPRRSGAR